MSAKQLYKTVYSWIRYEQIKSYAEMGRISIEICPSWREVRICMAAYRSFEARGK